jgi:hypothetical protein
MRSGIGFEAEKVPRPVRIDANLGRDLRAEIRLPVEARGQDIVGHVHAELGLGKDQEVADPDADRHERIEIVRLGLESAVDLARFRNCSGRLREADRLLGCAEVLTTRQGRTSTETLEAAGSHRAQSVSIGPLIEKV